MTTLKKIKNVERPKILVEHMLKVGWNVNHKWLDEESNKPENEQRGSESELERTVWGKYGSQYHLVSPDSVYSARVDSRYVMVFKLGKGLRKVVKFSLGTVELTENGFKKDLVNIIL